MLSEGMSAETCPPKADPPVAEKLSSRGGSACSGKCPDFGNVSRKGAKPQRRKGFADAEGKHAAMRQFRETEHSCWKQRKAQAVLRFALFPTTMMFPCLFFLGGLCVPAVVLTKEGVRIFRFPNSFCSVYSSVAGGKINFIFFGAALRLRSGP